MGVCCLFVYIGVVFLLERMSTVTYNGQSHKRQAKGGKGLLGNLEELPGRPLLHHRRDQGVLEVARLGRGRV